MTKSDLAQIADMHADALLKAMQVLEGRPERWLLGAMAGAYAAVAGDLRVQEIMVSISAAEKIREETG